MARKLVTRYRVPLNAVQPVSEICLELPDYTSVTRSAVELFRTRNASAPQAQAARLTEQFLRQNAGVFQILQIAVQRDYDGSDVYLKLESQGTVGAVPLRSPLTGRSDFGLVVQPRFPWSGIGPMLAEMGWLVAPAPLKLPLLRRSERRVPPWVLSFMLLARFRALLDTLDRRFEMTSEIRTAPKGRVVWTQYATQYMSRGNFLAVPCTFPDLQDDRQLKGMIRFAIEKQMQSLQTQVGNGAFVHRLIAFAESLLERVRGVTALRPSPGEMQFWMRRPLRNEAYTEGVQAIDWTVEDRGLAGLSSLDGIPWTMPMEQFFEAWVETVFRRIAQRVGGHVRAGRRRETVTPLAWEPAYTGSQRTLVPDLIMQTDNLAVIVDAKYKRHWEELQETRWSQQSESLREQHRADLLQVLAYANLVEAPQIVCCLVYPCRRETWESLEKRGRLVHHSELPHRGRRVHVWLTALPMSAETERVSTPLSERLLDLMR